MTPPENAYQAHFAQLKQSFENFPGGSPNQLTIETRFPLSETETLAIDRTAHACRQMWQTNQEDESLRLANPPFSGFFVQGLITSVNNPSIMLPLFNMEHDDGDALHGEETGIAQVRALLGPVQIKEERLILSFLGRNMNDCGGCIGFMLDNIHPESLIIQVDPQSPEIGVRRLKDLVVNIEDLPTTDTQALPPAISRVVQSLSANDFHPRGHWPYHDFSADPTRRYSAMTQLDDQKIWAGGHGPVDYRTVSPGQHLEIKLFDWAENHRIIYDSHPPDPNDWCLYFVGSGPEIVPRINYKDRNAILEWEHKLSKILQIKDLTLPVAVLSLSSDGTIQTRLTNTREIFPFPFHPKVLEG